MLFAGPEEQSQLDAAMNKAFSELDKKEVGSEDYAKILEYTVKLHRMKVDEKPSKVSPDTVLTVAANLLGILLIIRHEHVNVITSRAMDKLIRPK
jgi:hypothetical protein